MEETIHDFGKQLRSGDAGLFFFAGHGFQVKGRNYLIPIGAKIETKTLSEWPHDASQYLVREKSPPSRLFVDTEPERAKVRILNIKPKFHQGIMLNPGRYHIEVSANGYEMEKVWIKIEPGKDKIFKIFLKKLPQSPTKDRDKLVSIGNAYFDKGEYKKAIAAYKQAIRIDPDDAHAQYNLGIAYRKLGRLNEAIAAYKQAIRINPDDADAHYNLGIAYDKLGRDSDAIEAYKQAVRIDPDHAQAHYNLGVVYDKLGRNSDAIEAYKQAIRIDPDYAQAHYNLGIAYRKLGRHNQEIAAYKQAIRINPEYAHAQ